MNSSILKTASEKIIKGNRYEFDFLIIMKGGNLWIIIEMKKGLKMKEE